MSAVFSIVMSAIFGHFLTPTPLGIADVLNGRPQNENAGAYYRLFLTASFLRGFSRYFVLVTRHTFELFRKSEARGCGEFFRLFK